jgi:hypothetical protein
MSHPFAVLIPVLYSCPACLGSEYVQDDTLHDTHSCLCHECNDGYRKALLPAAELLAALALPAPESHAAIVALAETHIHDDVSLHNTADYPLARKARLPVRPSYQSLNPQHFTDQP